MSRVSSVRFQAKFSRVQVSMQSTDYRAQHYLPNSPSTHTRPLWRHQGQVYQNLQLVVYQELEKHAIRLAMHSVNDPVECNGKCLVNCEVVVRSGRKRYIV